MEYLEAWSFYKVLKFRVYKRKSHVFPDNKLQEEKKLSLLLQAAEHVVEKAEPQSPVKRQRKGSLQRHFKKNFGKIQGILIAY